MKTALLALAAVSALVVAPAYGQTKQPAAPKPARTAYAQVNGVNYYYEIHGRGEPSLLLHGGFGSIQMFGPALSKHRQVIGVDLYGHGRTALTDRDINMVEIGDDMAVLLKKRGYKQVDDL